MESKRDTTLRLLRGIGFLHVTLEPILNRPKLTFVEPTEEDHDQVWSALQLDPGDLNVLTAVKTDQGRSPKGHGVHLSSTAEI
jgi:hypothetical protein